MPKLEERTEQTDQNSDPFIRHLKDASEVVASWEPWERGILGTMESSNDSAERDYAANGNNGTACSAGDTNHNTKG